YREWDAELIGELFMEEDAKEILSIPLRGNGEMDRRIWHYSKDGKYTVKAGYHAGEGAGNRAESVYCGKWLPSRAGWLKCNVDGAIFGNRTMCGAGMVLRDAQCQLVAFRMMASMGTPSPKECEAMALYWPLRWLHERNHTHVILEVDALEVYHDI
ncbi:hypothetical protein LINPERHAP1_LOCUS23088, partial [Linum perenne]